MNSETTLMFVAAGLFICLLGAYFAIISFTFGFIIIFIGLGIASATLIIALLISWLSVPKRKKKETSVKQLKKLSYVGWKNKTLK